VGQGIQGALFIGVASQAVAMLNRWWRGTRGKLVDCDRLLRLGLIVVWCGAVVLLARAWLVNKEKEGHFGSHGVTAVGLGGDVTTRRI
jgi:hypothetical protein